MRRLADALSLFASALRRVIGAPDYERYVAHVRTAHPGARPLPYEEFTREALRRKYGTGAGRCC